MKMFSNQSREQLIIKFMSWGVVVLLVLMPAHAAISIIIGTKLNILTLVQSWKEIVIVLLSIGMLGLWYIRKKPPFAIDTVNILAIAFLVLATIVSLLRWDGIQAFAYGFKTDCMPLVLFLAVQSGIVYFTEKKISLYILIPAVAVAALAIIQSITTPVDVLNALGYGSTTINPAQIVDGSLGLIRAFSTLGGPNQLGAYLVIPICICLGLIIKKKKFVLSLVLPVLLAALALSYSRSAWVAAIVASTITVIFCLPKKYRLITSAGLTIVLLAVLLFVRTIVQSNEVTQLQNLLLHGRNFENQIQGSDEHRINVMSEAIHDARSNPIGLGLGHAGPASYQTSSTQITENWYLQIALEAGFLGLVIIVGLFIAIIWEFLKKSHTNQYLPTALAAALIGIMVSALFLHSLADSTLAYVLFASLGLTKRNVL